MSINLFKEAGKKAKSRKNMTKSFLRKGTKI